MSEAPKPKPAPIDPGFTLEELAWTPEITRKIFHWMAKRAVQDAFGERQDQEIFKGLTGFDPELFALGLADSLLDTGENLGALASAMISHPEETLYVLAKDLHALKEDPQVLTEAVLFGGEALSDWRKRTQEEKGAHASYDMGKLVGTLEARLLTQGGLTILDTPGRLEPAVGPKAHADLISDMFAEKVMSQVDKAIPSASGTLRPLFEDMNRRMHQTDSPLKIDAFAEMAKNLHLHASYPQAVPLKKSSLVFLRNELVTSFYLTNPERALQGKSFEFVTILSALLQATSLGALSPTTTNIGGVPIPIYIGVLPQTALARVGTLLQEMQKALAVGKTPGKDSLIALTDILIDNLPL